MLKSPVVSPIRWRNTPGIVSPIIGSLPGPESFPTNLLLWLDANDPQGNGQQYADGTAISTWTDKGPNALHASQATGSLQPIYKTNILNGKPVMRFDGVDDYLNTVSTGTVFTQSTFTFFVVAKVTTSNVNPMRYFAIRGAIGTGFGSGQWAGKTLVTSYGRFDYQSIAADQYSVDTWNNATQYWDPSFVGNLKVYKNEVYVEDVASGALGLTGAGNYPMTIGAAINVTLSGYEQFWLGDIAEIVIYSGDMYSTRPGDAVAISRYLGDKWGVT